MKPSSYKYYTASDIQKYHSGEMSFDEMNELEKSALEDPLLADAIDGYENKNNIEIDLAALREKIKTQNSKKSATNIRKLYSSISIAASVIVIFSIAYFLINKTENKDLQLSANTTNPKHSVSPVLHEASPTEQFENADSTSFAKNDNRNNNQSLISKSQNTDEISVSFSAKEAEELASILKSEKQKTSSKIIERTEIQPNAKALTLVSATQQQLSTKSETEAIALTDETKFDLDSKKETTANLNAGSYNLISADSINSSSIVKNNEVVSVTVSKAKHAIPAAANISNNADMQLQEVVISGYNNNRKKSINTSTQKVTAKDLEKTENKSEIDKTAFDNYVKTHKTTCIDKAGNEIHGIVTLKFNIDKKGKPEKIKVEQSLDKACDDQAIKLLNEGPKWNASLKKKKVVKITF
jgi:hypothetical protein